MTDVASGRELTTRGPVDGLPRNAMQEQFSLAFVRMVAAAAGCSIKSHETDYDGVDITIVDSREHKEFNYPELELQLKCTSQHGLLKDGYLAWTLERKSFLKLCNPKRFVPAFLGVLLIPEDPHRLLDLSEEGLTSESRMYWARATSLGDIVEGRANKTVRLPRDGFFDVPALQRTMNELGEGGGQ
ncbi:DUF4365 domain-containing protein [Actinoalloteichus hymeniacidonis]|uniref:DUF4365 domain-containing protein n=1 Tax=Actinoalloteichus hymeniacidonis TaxID=340345 RepID=A0AAC9HLN4_9PSEU|nr:DUF4365 domain-containing protein [Actinoalloteichus hymeniacidonis]AOS61564.1 hypothetical protein TL08_03660 [Actinoalloteichus hymeniacidonis]MBB5910427.1 hypothetical protein [Actinoalloteichus hymeniacidonis]